MDRQAQSDLAILAAAVAGAAVAQLVKARSARARALSSGPALVLPTVIGTVSIARRGGKVLGLYPERTLWLAAGAFAVGAGLGLVSHAVGGLLPKTE